jgi:class 3 adenylate cyclase
MRATLPHRTARQQGSGSGIPDAERWGERARCPQAVTRTRGAPGSGQGSTFSFTLVTVLFADLKGSMELLADRDPEEARKLLDPVLERMMEAVHRYEGTVNQVMGDGIMALFGAPLAHEDHAVRACYAALDMQGAIRRYAEEVWRTDGITVKIRVGLNSGEVVVRAIDSDLRVDYTAVGQTTHLAARMEQLAIPGTALLTAGTLRLAEGYVTANPLGPVPMKGLEAPLPACPRSTHVRQLTVPLTPTRASARPSSCSCSPPSWRPARQRRNAERRADVRRGRPLPWLRRGSCTAMDLTRVEIKDLVDESAVRRAWETARAATWLLRCPRTPWKAGRRVRGAYAYSIW